MKLFNALLGFALLSISFFSCTGPVDIGKHEWKVMSINGAAATQEQLSNMTLKFGDGQKVSGQAPCNEFRGKAVYNKEKIKFSTLYTDSKNCDEFNIEQAYLASLEMSATYTQTADRLVLYDDQGNITVEMQMLEE
ncbi:META domain-containing protein [Echinicola jeungdonensis]|uniref:META domain-containing protein n=1 Tax=Echinicola jeungdonensis TaxID=709343 RepID=A0ABV5J4U0_9BACT|nr:META domain-containing protein [Echinicola jeungdonensis]MDN3668839.1 META domain-containing protein [Echinicola jeungdonensis]